MSKDKPTMGERLASVETLLNHIISNDLKHIQRWIYGIVASVIGLALAIVADKIF